MYQKLKKFKVSLHTKYRIFLVHRRKKKLQIKNMLSKVSRKCHIKPIRVAETKKSLDQIAPANRVKIY